MITYKEIEINVSNNTYVETKGLNFYLDKEVRIVIGRNLPENYIYVIKYIIDYILDTKRIISENQNIGYYSWLLQFRLDKDNFYTIYEVNSEGSDFNKGCDTAISVVRHQGEVCWQESLIPLFPNFNQSIVISDGVYEGKDIEGIRYDSPQDECGWYLITDDYNNDIKSLKVVHFYHVAFSRPDILKYLAIPFGHRFLMKEGNVEIRKNEEE
ncbi:immunity protein Imm33 domain-containing protein [Chryseobacterium sp. Mn2064]|uniref:immunity protein Imm33 domain-containing protein n=1 Tax=Chryseobacterium sp. Mn2064 TaxID=3395263 RepID=UPI003BE361C7